MEDDEPFGGGGRTNPARKERDQTSKWYCDVCDQSFESCEQKAQHLYGKKHVVMQEKGRRFQRPEFKGEELHRWIEARKFLRAERKRADALYRLQESQLSVLQHFEEQLLRWDDETVQQPQQGDGKEKEKEKDTEANVIQENGYISPAKTEELMEKIFKTLDSRGVTREQVTCSAYAARFGVDLFVRC